jgi:hypothetical protein
VSPLHPVSLILCAFARAPSSAPTFESTWPRTLQFAERSRFHSAHHPSSETPSQALDFHAPVRIMFSPMEPVYLCTRATLDTDRGPVHLGLLGPEDTSQMVLETSVCDAADPLNSQLISAFCAIRTTLLTHGAPDFVAQELLLAMNIARASSPLDDGTRLTDASVFAQVISVLLRYLHANLPTQAWTPSVLATVLFLRRTAGYLALPPDHEWDAPLLLFSAALMLADKVRRLSQ